jgi:hypothetical protein
MIAMPSGISSISRVLRLAYSESTIRLPARTNGTSSDGDSPGEHPAGRRVRIESNNNGSVEPGVLRVLWFLMPFLFLASRGRRQRRSTGDDGLF